MNDKPVSEFREGVIKASVFERTAQGKTGDFISQSVALQISYTDKDGNWKNNQLTIVKKNIGAVLRVLNKAALKCGVQE